MSQSRSTVTNVYTTNCLADALDTSVRSIRRLNSAGKIPKPSRLGGQLRWGHAEIEAWVRSGMPDRKTWERMWSALKPS